MKYYIGDYLTEIIDNKCYMHFIKYYNFNNSATVIRLNVKYIGVFNQTSHFVNNAYEHFKLV